MGAPTVRTESRLPAMPATLPAKPVTRRIDVAEIDCNPHSVEREVCRVLTSQPGLSISSLVVRRTPDGLYLSGVIESNVGDADVCGLVRAAAGVDEVVNRLLVRAAAAE